MKAWKKKSFSFWRKYGKNEHFSLLPKNSIYSRLLCRKKTKFLPFFTPKVLNFPKSSFLRCLEQYLGSQTSNRKRVISFPLFCIACVGKFETCCPLIKKGKNNRQRWIRTLGKMWNKRWRALKCGKVDGSFYLSLYLPNSCFSLHVFFVVSLVWLRWHRVSIVLKGRK